MENNDSNNKGYFDKVSDNASKALDKHVEGQKEITNKQSAVDSNKNATSTQKVASSAISVAERTLAATAGMMGAVTQLGEAAMMPIMEKLAFMKGQAILPVVKQTDPVLGIDVHMVVIPPSPAPVPIPHPYIGISFRAKDFVACAIATFLPMPDTAPSVDEDSSKETIDTANKQRVKAIGHQVASMAIGMLGATVKFGGYLPRTVAGTPSKSIPHFPIGAGFHPGFSRMVEKNHGHALLGSFFVVADSTPLAGAPDHLHNDCWDVGTLSIHNIKPNKNTDGSKKKFQTRLYVPSGVYTPIPWTRPVITNPVPAPINPLQAPQMLFKAGFGKLRSKRTANKIHSAANSAMKKAGINPKGKFGRGVHKAICTVTGHPVDVSSGMFFTDNEDFSLAGPIPLVWERTYYNTSDYKGPLGYGWHHSYDMGLSIEPKENLAVIRLEDGRACVFKLPKNTNEPSFDRKEKLFLHLHEDGFYFLENAEGLQFRFTDKKYLDNEKEQQLLRSISNKGGYAIRFSYKNNGALETIIDSAGRTLNVETDNQARITAIYAPHPDDKNRTFAIAQYSYSDQGDLAIHIDALGKPMTFEYDQHLMVREVWRNGQEWFFVYDGKGIGAKCIHTWGTGNLFNHKIQYDGNTTIVTNSLGHKTIYHHDGKLVHRKIEPNGAEWKYGYNRYNELDSETDPLGNQTGYTYDRWGNMVTQVTPDGLFTQMEYLNSKLPLLVSEVTDAQGGKWKWNYDALGNLLERTNPKGAKTQFKYQDGLLHSVTDAQGAITKLVYDGHYNLSRIIAPNGAATHYDYNLLGQLTKITNPNGVMQTRSIDLLGRPTQINDFDNNIIQLKYDALDNVIHYKDRKKEVKYTYKGLWKLTSRTEASATIRFKYDTEEQLRYIVNEQGDSYNFELDAVGNVTAESGFDGVTKQYDRNLAGWVTKVHRPSKRHTQYQYDQAGRITEVTYHDGTAEKYSYDKGMLIKAENDTATVSFERDAMGNVIAESCNGDDVKSFYDILDRRTAIQSSLGADIALELDELDNITKMTANGWQADFKYDHLGLEIERNMFAGVSTHIQRDRLGRIKSQRVSVGQSKVAPAKLFRQYTWDANDQLKQIVDQGRGTTTFEHDTWGNLSKTTFGDGAIQLRNPDKVGNLFETKDRRDRKYDKGGRLIESKNAKFEYDAEGFLIKKKCKNGDVWRYEWNAAGMLSKVLRPDQNSIIFAYDALGRRIYKKYKQTTTHWLWDGNKPLHEWKAFDFREGTADDLITWIFNEDDFSPTAKIKGDKKYSLVCDHLGTPIQGYNEEGSLIWDRELDSYGNVRMLKGEEGFCNYLYQGQTLDNETGLVYNRFRYYAPEEGMYISQDPIGLHGGIQLYGYVHDTNGWVDVFGLRGEESFPSWMKKTKGFERHHIIPYHLKDHPIISKSGMNINGATNMVSLPRYEGNHPTKVTHRHFKIGGEPHADYNAKMLGELDELNNRAIAENWNSERMRQEILDLQHDTRKKLNNRAGYKGCKG